MGEYCGQRPLYILRRLFGDWVFCSLRCSQRSASSMGQNQCRSQNGKYSSPYTRDIFEVVRIRYILLLHCISYTLNIEFTEIPIIIKLQPLFFLGPSS